MITSAAPRSRIDGGDHSARFFGFQIDRSSPQRLLAANRQYAPILASSGDILPQQMLHKTADCRQTAISRSSGVPTSRFDMIEEGEYRVRLDIVKGQVAHGLVSLIGQEQVKELQRIPVRPHCVSAGSACVLQVIMKEAFSQAEKGF